MSALDTPEPTLADHGATMAYLRGRAGGDGRSLNDVEEWGRAREARLPVLRGFALLLRRNGIIGGGMNRIERNFVIMQCFAIATKHGLDMMGYAYRDSESGPRAALMNIDLHAVESDGEGAGRVPFPDGAAEGAFLREVSGKGRAELGRMARLAVIPERERMNIP